MLHDTAPLRTLWKAAFGDTDAFLDCFFRHGYDPSRCHSIRINGEIAAALYWLDCEYDGRKLAYIYAVATEESHRGKGLCRALMSQTHDILKSQGYAGSVLVPAGEILFAMYEKMGYRICSTMDSISCQAADPVPMKKRTAGEYAALRRLYLPQGGILQEGKTLDFLHSYADLYSGQDFLLAGYAEDGCFNGLELLGDPAAAPGILGALGVKKGTFRIPGKGQPFAMYYPLTDAPIPGYFGLALD